ncbi:MAG TPA: M43 family zinc metalloprotease [Flavisolibacter sp.]|nr:M43 family zinc metalloprotease [Flavisolibacter sp.]
MRTILFGICMLFAFSVCAQRPCASSDYTTFQQSNDPSVREQLNRVEAFIRSQQFASRMTGIEGEETIIRIPVVVHVLYNTAAQNISDAQVKSQIDALNRDFRRNNADTVNTPARFRSLAADIKIEFALAKADPKGRATTGIVRKQSSVKEWKMDDKIKFTAQGGDDAWDSRSYLNIWVGPMRSLLGYASYVGGPADKDGIVINTTAFGTVNVAAPYHLGRTAVHEVGHWLGLKHIWGDTYCGDDAVGDTPKQGNFTPGCPSTFRSSCSNGTDGDMYMNYMDFTDDACVNLFTNGQKARMLALFNAGGPRHAILSSKGLHEPWVEEAPPAEEPQAVVPAAVRLYPNPAVSELVLNFDTDASWIGKSVSIVNQHGVVLMTGRVCAAAHRMNLSSLKPGMYFVLAENGEQKIREKFIKL